MMPRRNVLIGLAAMAPARALAVPCCGSITASGQRLLAFLDGSGVDHLWLAGFRVDWESGASIQAWPTAHRHTHCSAFAASAAMRLGIYLLRPPQHSQALLANAQMGWLRSTAAADQGWEALFDVNAAQLRGNRGALVVAVFENPSRNDPGHIAIVRPSEIDGATLLAQGPFVTQAGGHNWLSVPLAEGFAGHKTAWHAGGTGDVQFFAHEVDWAAVPA